MSIHIAGCGGTKHVTGQPPSLTGDQTFYGHIVSMKQSAGGGYLMQFDPAWYLSGITANVAAAQDEHIACAPEACAPVPDDHHIVDESHRALTFIVPAATRGAVLTRKDYLNGVQISATELAGVVAGTSALKLFEPLASGVWITVHIDIVTSFRQQYQP